VKSQGNRSPLFGHLPEGMPNKEGRKTGKHGQLNSYFPAFLILTILLSSVER
jgi:hypothetical protein